MNLVRGYAEIEKRIKSNITEGETLDGIPFLFYKGMGEKVCYVKFEKNITGLHVDIFARTGNYNEPQEKTLTTYYNASKSREVLYDSVRDVIILDITTKKIINISDWTYLFTEGFPGNLPGRDLLLVSENSLESVEGELDIYKFFPSALQSKIIGLSNLSKDFIIPNALIPTGERMGFQLLSNACGMGNVPLSAFQGTFPFMISAPSREPFPLEKGLVNSLDRIATDYFTKRKKKQPEPKNIPIVVPPKESFGKITSSDIMAMTHLPEEYTEVEMSRGLFPELSEYAFASKGNLYVYPVMGSVYVDEETLAMNLGISLDHLKVIYDVIGQRGG
jgi:hypothetical protein